MMLASLVFTVMVALVKVARQELGVFELVLWRGFVSVPLLLVMAQGQLAVRSRRTMLFRCVTGFAAMTCFFGAAKGMAVADLQIISRLLPVAIAFVAPIALGSSEKPQAGTWVVLFTGLVGCAVIISPSPQAWRLDGALLERSKWGLLALGSVLFSAASHTAVRALAHERATAVAFWLQLFVTLTAGGIWLLGGRALPPLHLLPILAGVGVLAALGQWLMTRAYAEEQAATVAAASYVAPVFGVLADLVAFSVWPTWQVLVGGGLVTGAGLWLVFRPKAPTSHSAH